MPRAKCANCGATLPAKAKFCPECGTPVGAEPGETAVQELPPSETGPVPVEAQVAERRVFGVPPATMLLILGVILVGIAIVLFATGNWPWGLILLGLGLFVLTGFVSQSRRLPGETSRVGRASVAAIDSMRARAGAAAESAAVQTSATIEVRRLRRELRSLGSDRGLLLRELGEVVYEENESARKDVMTRIKELDETIQAKEEQMANIMTEAQRRVGRARMEVQPTEILSDQEEPPDQPPEPATVPEPMPPPDEGAPPQPARVPEPMPPPDEADRPRQPTVPEPGPTPPPD
jgi:hypothetical protein